MTEVKMIKGDAVKLCDQEWQIKANEAAGWVVEGDESDADIEALKAEADKLGIEYSPRIGAKTLAERIAEAKK